MITLSTMSSDSTPASDLDATVDFSVVDSQLQIMVTNNTTAPNAFNINQIYWNGSADVTSLTLLSATHSANGDVFDAWNPVETGVLPVGLFGVFDFALTGGVGQGDPSLIQPGNSITFVLDITGACATAMDCNALDDFASIATTQGWGVAAKFVNGPGDDSAFGASPPVPEPGSFGLVAVGLLGLAIRTRRHRAG